MSSCTTAEPIDAGTAENENAHRILLSTYAVDPAGQQKLFLAGGNIAML